MTPLQMIAMVETYFKAVDAGDLPGILALLGRDCVFTVETHGVELNGADDISGMFDRLWANHAGVRHHRFVHVADADTGAIASRFEVENTEHDGSVTRKSNCNFFHISQDRFDTIAVYMAGPNTLDRAG